MLYAGTSGFAYPNWKPRFYPADLPSKRFLEYYAKRLNSVEINYTFRRLPAESTLENWIKATREGFLFALKAHERITHILSHDSPAVFVEMPSGKLEVLTKFDLMDTISGLVSQSR